MFQKNNQHRYGQQQIYMKYDELAFFNQQLAGMLKSGIPLEGALRQLCANMSKGKLRGEFEHLEADLSRGVPLGQALAKRKLPEFYVRMLQVGSKSNQLPLVLTLVADYYQSSHIVVVRLKGLMVYPAIVLTVALAVSVLLSLILSSYFTQMQQMTGAFFDPDGMFATPAPPGPIGLWLPTALLGVIFILVSAFAVFKEGRAWGKWHLPGFKEASLSQFSHSIALLLTNGVPLNEALLLVGQLESNRALKWDIQIWQARMAAGLRRFPEISAGSKTFPPLFRWLVASSNEDWPAGFMRAAEIYNARAAHRIETMLYAALPVTIVFLGTIILVQLLPFARLLTSFMKSFGGGDL